MSDTPEVPQPVFSKATHVPPPVAHTSTTLNGGRGAPAPNGVGRGFGRGDRGESIAGRGCVRNESHERRLRLAESADEHRRRAARCASRERYTTSAGIALCCVVFAFCGRAFAFGEREGAFCDR